MIFLTGFVCALTRSMYSVKKSFLVLPTSSGKEVSRVDLKKFFVKSCKDKDNYKDNGKDNDKNNALQCIAMTDDNDKDKEKDIGKDRHTQKLQRKLQRI